MPEELTRQFRKDVKERYGFPQTFYVYTQDEADERGLDYVYWRDVIPHQYALTDDGYVGLCVRENIYANDHRGYTQELTFSFGRKMINRKPDESVRGHPELSWEACRDSASPKYLKPQGWGERISKTGRARRAVQLYARLFVAHQGHLSEEDWSWIGRAFEPKAKIPEASAKVLFKQTEIREMAAEEVKALLTEEGLDERRVIQMYQEAYDTAQDTDKANVMKSVADSLVKLHGMRSPRPHARGEPATLISYEEIHRELGPAEQAAAPLQEQIDSIKGEIEGAQVLVEEEEQ